MRRALAVLLMLGSAHPKLLYLNSAFRHSATFGVEQAASESKVVGNLALLFLAVAVCLQLLIAWLWKPRQLSVPSPTGSPPVMQLPESRRP